MTRTAALAALLALAACGPAERPAAPAPPADFTVRGRWPDPLALRYRVDAAHAPLDAAAFARAVDRAVAAWNATGVVQLRPAAADGAADISLSFRRGHHGACEPFGPSTDVAHAGPVAPGTFVHFDAARSWSEDGANGLSVFHTALHELGHVLGLGHAEAADAVMSTAMPRPAALAWHDLAGLHSLYGGGRDGDGDVHIVAAGGATAAVLRAVAPADRCEVAVFDADGDGNADVLVWRTDAAGHGALRIFSFGRGPVLQRTLGPFVGAVVPGARVGCLVAPGGERLLVSTIGNGAPLVRQFDRFAAPVLPTAPFAASVLAAAGRSLVGDLGADGRVEQVRSAASAAR